MPGVIEKLRSLEIVVEIGEKSRKDGERRTDNGWDDPRQISMQADHDVSRFPPAEIGVEDRHGPDGLGPDRLGIAGLRKLRTAASA
jgi:hypothetical protein